MTDDALWYAMPVLSGRLVQLEPLRIEHAPGYLAAAGSPAQSAEIFRWQSPPGGALTAPVTVEDAGRHITAALAARARGQRLAYAQLDARTGEFVGTTSLADLDPVQRSVTIGYTWLGRRWWGSGLNAEAKLLLMSYAFETLGAVRVAWVTDIRNTRAQAAIERLGAVREGVLRKHRRRADGSWRDTVLYAMLDDDWPAAKKSLAGRLDGQGREGRVPPASGSTARVSVGNGDDRESLAGGINEVVRIGNRVRRPTGPWSPQVHDLLRYLEAAGFRGAPRVHEVTPDGFEILDFLPGEVSNYPATPAAASPEALESAAALLRDYHDATAAYATTAPRDGWQAPAREPVEVICHGDFAPHNCVLDGNRVAGIIDFDFAHPGPRLWDVAYAAYRWVPLTVPGNADGFGATQEQAARLRIFCDRYGLDDAGRAGLIDAVAARLNALVDFMHAGGRRRERGVRRPHRRRARSFLSR
ncbi:GNAT family N-acetyltransferase [Actinoplanes sp. KI2]|uniref:GNAT family N-acetyltransferase n=1 Tax=Actinoplanes sp. KI2 TaxID=2983315 RepID=UPI0021D5DD27|nr:GNAT family N-acetyltransferase [Actinoplanes sp. KI2]MCU7729685.1 GNAT family N-acetyltransferase [Actinoplanes sp. KI2]